MPNQDMLAFTYRIQKIIRDMKHTTLPTGEDEEKRDAVVALLAAVQERIEQAFGQDPLV